MIIMGILFYFFSFPPDHAYFNYVNKVQRLHRREVSTGARARKRGINLMKNANRFNYSLGQSSICERKSLESSSWLQGNKQSRENIRSHVSLSLILHFFAFGNRDASALPLGHAGCSKPGPLASESAWATSRQSAMSAFMLPAVDFPAWPLKIARR